MSATEPGRVVVVTGANEGIGYHLLRSLVADGYGVAGLDVDGSNLRLLENAHPERVRYLDCDVTEDADVDAAVDAVLDDWGRIDILVNNAGVFEFAPFEDQTLDDTRREFEVNVFGSLRLIHAVLPHMRAREEGIVHTVSSGAGLVGHPGLTGYAATKGALEAFVRSLRLELRHEDVAATVMHPPLTKTRSAADLGYPDSLLADPTDVGRNLADKIESTDRVVYADWQTRIGLYLSRRIPWLVERGTARFVSPPE